ncbi:MAG: endonuclease [Bacteroidota bacterium]
MIKNLMLVACVLVSSLASAQVSIATARSTSIGSVVTVKGVVTNGSELGGIRYLQDGTGGIAAYWSPAGGASGIARYDSITVTGTLTEFNGLLEMTSPSLTFTDHGPATVTPQPVTVPLTAINESLEAQYIMINNVTFVQSGNFAANTTYQVTDGVNTIDIRVTGSATNIDGTAIPTGAVSIKGVVGQFNTAYQVLPRETADITAYVAPQREINVKINGVTYLSGSNVFIGTAASTPIVIENYGIGNLTISSAPVTGAQAAAYSTNIVPVALGATSNTNYTLSFIPSTTGTQIATLTINSDDDDEAAYVLNFEGAGTDNLATSPTGAASALTFPDVKAYTIGAQFSPASGASKYLVLWSNGSPVAGTPTDGMSYLRGDVIGNAKVAYIGTATSFVPRGIIANQTYHFAVYPFNGQGGIENYYTTTPLTGSVTSSGANTAVMTSYYAGIDPQSPTFIADLTALINPHTFVSYYNYQQTMMNLFEVKDTTGGQSFATCLYSDYKALFPDNFTWTATDFSREHVYCHSWMHGVGGAEVLDTHPAYTDQHNLWPTKMINVNGLRSNYPYGEVVTASTTFMETKFGNDAAGNNVYEPRDAAKGNGSRSMMYHAVTYNGLNGANWALPDVISFIVPYGQDACVIKAWHEADLPDNYEIARHEYAYSVQGNRNPFIDHPEWAQYINFSNLTTTSTGACTTGMAEQVASTDVAIYPVPATDNLTIAINGTVISSYQILDVTGRVVIAAADINVNETTLNVQDLTSGTYMVRLSTPKGNVTRTVVVE